MNKQNMKSMVLLFFLILLVNLCNSKESFLKENSENESIDLENLNINITSARKEPYYGRPKSQEIFVNISKEMNKIFQKYNDSMMPEEFVENYIFSKYNKNFSIPKEKKEKIIENNMAIVNILNKTNITNATNATNPLHFQTIFGMSKHYFYLMKDELDNYDFNQEIKFRAGIILMIGLLSILCLGIISLYALFMAKKCNLFLNNFQKDERKLSKNNMNIFRYYQNTIDREI